MLDVRESLKGDINTGHERRVFELPDNVEIFFLSDVTQVPLRVEITKRVEGHGLDSWR